MIGIGTIGVVLALAAGQPSGSQLIVLNWFDYMDPAVIATFEAAHGLTVKQVHFESDEMREQLLVQSSGRGYDLMLVNGIMLEPYVQQGWLRPLDHTQIPSLRHVDRHWRELFPHAASHGVPYFWGTTGIAYRSDLVPGALTSWNDLYRPAPPLQGRITMIHDARDVVAMALKALGHSLNTQDPDAVDAAIALVAAQRPHVMSYEYDPLNEQARLVRGASVAALMYSGDALALRELEPAIRYVVPAEGTNLWVDYWTVSAHTAEPERAWRFLEFINQPEIAAQLARFVHYASPNAAARRLLPTADLEDPLIYPDAEVLARSEVYQPLAPELNKRYQAGFRWAIQ